MYSYEELLKRVKENSNLKEDEQPFENVIGHKKHIEELLQIIDWFNNLEEFNKKGISIPKGVLFAGAPGNGKTLLIKEFIKCVKCPTFILDWNQNDVVKDIQTLFEKAIQAGKSIVVIDEIDLLIGEDDKIIRTLQECLDGINSNNNILVLAACNHLKRLPQALLRNGRFGKPFQIELPSDEDLITLFKKSFEQIGIKLADNFDYDEISIAFNRLSFADVKAIINDVVLRNGLNGINEEMVIDSIYNTTKTFNFNEEDNYYYEAAVHESCHAVMAYNYRKYFLVKRLTMDSSSGCFETKVIDDDYESYDKRIANVNICLAGVIGEKLFCKDIMLGNFKDLQNARKSIYHLVNNEAYYSCSDTLPGVNDDGARRESQKKLVKNERKIYKILNNSERYVKKYLRKHKNQVINLANELFKKKRLSSHEIIEILERKS